MESRRVIKSVLHNFLGTYISRYSDFDGYWVFGFLVDDLNEVEFDLLDKTAGKTDTPWGFAKLLAAARFQDQMRKARFEEIRVKDARLRIARLPQTVSGPVNGRLCTGHHIRLFAEAIMDSGRRYQREAKIFVAPHDPRVESRSTRPDDRWSR
jgi:hypothetical protein